MVFVLFLVPSGVFGFACQYSAVPEVPAEGRGGRPILPWAWATPSHASADQEGLTDPVWWTPCFREENAWKTKEWVLGPLFFFLTTSFCGQGERERS